MSDNPKITPLPFEKPLFEMQKKIDELVMLSRETGVSFQDDVERLRRQSEEIEGKLYGHLSPIQKLQIARHPQRPNFLEIAKMISPATWFELHGDRAGTDDRAIIGGLAEIGNQPVLLLGTQKGRGMKENLTHNFGMANPEGYRKALRLFYHAEKFKMPIITFIDTPGAYPGIDGEQHNIGQAIAFNLREMARMKVPIISVVLGEASSGGALGIGVANHIYMLEHALYTVISPEGCASILWRSADYAQRAAEALKITAQDLLSFGMIERIIAEPVGGAHRDPECLRVNLMAALEAGLAELLQLSPDALVEARYNKYRSIGAYQLRN